MEFSKESVSNRSIGVLENDVRELKKTLLRNFERIEAVLLKAKSTASREKQQYEDLRQMDKAKIAMLEVQLQEKEESLRTKESALKLLEESFTAKIQELEHRLTEKEDLTGLLEQRTAEITNLRSGTQRRVAMLEVQLQEKEESLRTKESAVKSAIKQLEESFTAKIQELETHNQKSL
jgi:chromosome segregation ATPase